MMLIYIGLCGDVADVSSWQNSIDIYWQYLLMKATTLLLYIECLETQVVTSPLIH